LREIRRELSGAHEKIARNALDVIPGKPTIVTLSRSLAVSAILKALSNRKRLAQVYVLESKPGREGRRAVVELVAGGVPAKLAEDRLGVNLVRRADLVLTGADTVLLDGSLVNKAGTHELALAAEATSKPFFSACETLKIDSLRTAQTFPMPTSEAGLREVLFDLTPSQFVTSFITDRGVFEPKNISRVWLL
jgi:translation initiation factor eIF-2B subunit delta